MTNMTIRINILLFGTIVLLATFGLLTAASWLSTDVAAQTMDRESWTMQTRIYPSRGSTWDAYVLNVSTGDLYFVNQAKMTKVREGKAKGAK